MTSLVVVLVADLHAMNDAIGVEVLDLHGLDVW